MTPQEQRIAIAFHFGWKLIEGGSLDFEDCLFAKPGQTEGPWCKSFQVPDYLNDLNAMHEAEKVLSKNQQGLYMENLYTPITLEDRNKDTLFDYAHANASQRAEAFLRTIGKWKD